jgi:hypothetical protein
VGSTPHHTISYHLGVIWVKLLPSKWVQYQCACKALETTRTAGDGAGGRRLRVRAGGSAG